MMRSKDELFGLPNYVPDYKHKMTLIDHVFMAIESLKQIISTFVAGVIIALWLLFLLSIVITIPVWGIIGLLTLFRGGYQ